MSQEASKKLTAAGVTAAVAVFLIGLVVVQLGFYFDNSKDPLPQMLEDPLITEPLLPQLVDESQYYTLCDVPDSSTYRILVARFDPAGTTDSSKVKNAKALHRELSRRITEGGWRYRPDETWGRNQTFRKGPFADYKVELAAPKPDDLHVQLTLRSDNLCSPGREDIPPP